MIPNFSVSLARPLFSSRGLSFLPPKTAQRQPAATHRGKDEKGWIAYLQDLVAKVETAFPK
jgi:hypothetical protein